jgi:hypothetical protein
MRVLPSEEFGGGVDRMALLSDDPTVGVECGVVVEEVESDVLRIEIGTRLEGKRAGSGCAACVV